MKKRSMAWVLMMVCVLTVSSRAIGILSVTTKPVLSFSGTTASCGAICSGKDSDSISATLTLYQGSTRIDSWSGSGTGRVSVSGTKTVTRGKTYTLKLTYTVNGVAQSSTSVSGTCR